MVGPTPIPSLDPTAVSSPESTPVPSSLPTALPTPVLSPVPTAAPSPEPTPVPTSLPSGSPIPLPSSAPTPIPSPLPTIAPSPVGLAALFTDVYLLSSRPPFLPNDLDALRSIFQSQLVDEASISSGNLTFPPLLLHRFKLSVLSSPHLFVDQLSQPTASNSSASGGGVRLSEDRSAAMSSGSVNDGGLAPASAAADRDRSLLSSPAAASTCSFASLPLEAYTASSAIDSAAYCGQPAEVGCVEVREECLRRGPLDGLERVLQQRRRRVTMLGSVCARGPSFCLRDHPLFSTGKELQELQSFSLHSSLAIVVRHFSSTHPWCAYFLSCPIFFFFLFFFSSPFASGHAGTRISGS